MPLALNPFSKTAKAQKKFEAEIKKALTGGARQTALDFAAFLRANDLTLEKLDIPGGWNVYVKGINSAFVQIFRERNNFNVVLHISGYDGEGPVDDNLKAFAWAHVVTCPEGCGGPEFCNESQNRRTILGREYESTCQSPLAFLALEADDLAKVQTLLLLLH